MRKFAYKLVAGADADSSGLTTFECFMNQGVGFIGFVTKRRHGYCYGRDTKTVLGYTKTRRAAAERLADLREYLIKTELAHAK